MLLWAASAGNEGASWIMLVAVFVYVLHHFSASSLAIAELVGTLPALLCMPFAGAIADRRDVRKLAMGSMTARRPGWRCSGSERASASSSRTPSSMVAVAWGALTLARHVRSAGGRAARNRTRPG